MERWQPCSRALASQLSTVLTLLRRTQPDVQEYDVAWHGPYFVRRSREERWCPTRFMLYDGRLFAWVRIGPGSHALVWRIGRREVHLEHECSWSHRPADEQLWPEVLRQVRGKLQRALRDPERCQRFVTRLLPADCREGVIQRHWTWPKDLRSAMPPRTIDRAARAIERGKSRPLWPWMTLGRLRKCEAVCYGAAFPELRKLTPLAQRRKRADTRDGGLLDLPVDDAGAFARWYHGRTWAGTHPWEIVFGHPHGILLQPYQPRDEGAAAGASRPDPEPGWRLALSVETEGLYRQALRMAIALDAAGAPFELVQADAVRSALRGDDDVEVGPDLYQIHYQELARQRPDAVPHIRWQDVPRIQPITTDQAVRVEHVLRTGRPPASA